jgi:hypothetical protein
VIWLPTPFRARITDPPTVRFEPDPCEPTGIPRPTAAELERIEQAERFLTKALGPTPS